LAASSSLRATQQLPSWLFSKAKKASHDSNPVTSATTGNSTYVSHDPMEGVLQMDRPLLQCQEIFTHLIGTHQTMLISKEQVVQMLKDDAAKEREAKQKRGGVPEENVEVSLEDAQALFSGQTQELFAAEAKAAEEEKQAATTSHQVTEGGGVEDNSVSNHDPTGTETGEDSATPTDSNAIPEEPLPGTEDDEEQPLVGYWIWENSLYTHKMKMHLAQNSDLALHVVLAVIVNQVRYERNAIALTI
jgi:hypothetical protein